MKKLPGLILVLLIALAGSASALTATVSYQDGVLYWEVTEYEGAVGIYVNGMTVGGSTSGRKSIPLEPGDVVTIKDFCDRLTFTDLVKEEPTATPTAEPTATPTVEPTATPTVEPTPSPTAEPTATPTVRPTMKPIIRPTLRPTMRPTIRPTVRPTATPSATPTAEPTATPTAEPTVTPTAEPTATPTVIPTVIPTATPTAEPTVAPTANPTEAPSSDVPKTGDSTNHIYVMSGLVLLAGICLMLSRKANT